MKTPIYFISDIHLRLSLDKKEKERRAKLYRLLDTIKKDGGTIFFVGDLFDFYFEYPHMIPKSLYLLYKSNDFNVWKSEVLIFLNESTNLDAWTANLPVSALGSPWLLF